MRVDPGSTSQRLTVTIVADDGTPVTGLVAATFPATYYARAGAAEASISLSDLALITTGYTSGGVKEIGQGRYRLDAPDLAFATAVEALSIIGEATDKRLIHPVMRVAFPVIAPLNSAGETVARTTDIPTAVAIANEVEAQIIDETDSEKVLEAMVNKINAMTDLDVLTLSAIAAAVRTNLATELARIDAAITSRPNAAAIAGEIMNYDVGSVVGVGTLGVYVQNINAKAAYLPAIPAGEIGGLVTSHASSTSGAIVVSGLGANAKVASDGSVTLDAGDIEDIREATRPQGDGDVEVTSSYGSADALRYTVGGNGVDGVTVTAYEASAYASSGTAAPIVAQTSTGSDGRFGLDGATTPLYLDPGGYVLQYKKAGVIVTQTTSLTVAAP